MTAVQLKSYQVVVWADGERLSDEPALRLHFETLEDALRALDTHRNSGRYRSGMLMQWDKQTGNWKLVAQFC